MSSVLSTLSLVLIAANLAALVDIHRIRRRALKLRAKAAYLSRRPVAMEADTVHLSAHPAIKPSEIDDALRFGFAAAQKYLDELSAEYRVANDD